ncbi:hypothetical protein GBA52_017312 [Prunus armeniaca]|nr:hypothetical protein GBA52_017312 [Prunus armeniaca]
MEGEGKKEAWSIEQGQIKGDQDHEFSLPSAHTIGHDSWQQVGFMLATSFNCRYILSFSNLMLVPLGWTWGVVCMVVVGFYSLYINWLLAAFHFNNGQMFIGYRDLMGYLYDVKMCYFTWVLQFVTLLLGNMGFILLGGRALKSTLRKPAVTNMRKALYVQFSGGILFYWACGSKVSENLPNELSGPKWAKVLINAAVSLQSIVSQHMFVTPIHEAIDTKFLKLDKCMNTKENLKRKFFLRAFFFIANTFVTSAIPFMGDFVNLFGSFSLVPLTFVFPSMIFIKL